MEDYREINREDVKLKRLIVVIKDNNSKNLERILQSMNEGNTTGVNKETVITNQSGCQAGQ